MRAQRNKTEGGLFFKALFYKRKGSTYHCLSLFNALMKTLAINSALPLTEIALLEDGKVLMHKSWPSNYNEAEKLLPEIQKILQKHGQPDQIFAVQGPGAFTGLRVGITIANSLAYIFGVPIKTCTTFEYLDQKTPEQKRESTAILMRAGSGVAVVLPNVEKVHKINKDELADFLAAAPHIKAVVSDVRSEARENYQLPKGTKWLELEALPDFAQTVQAILESERTNHKVIKPQYLAPPHITKSKKQQFA